ncbi:MAG: leucine-rich repeat protein, partial [Firmicutes bacterium]|nr:leucine-rich repeat protein [Bacillota bacterium]
VTEIGEETFSDCEALEKIVLPKSITNIGDGAFNNCPSLTIYAEAEKPIEWAAVSGLNIEWGYKGNQIDIEN